MGSIFLDYAALLEKDSITISHAENFRKFCWEKRLFLAVTRIAL